MKNNTKGAPLRVLVNDAIAEREQREAEARKLKVASVVNDILDKIKREQHMLNQHRECANDVTKRIEALQERLAKIKGGDEDALKTTLHSYPSEGPWATPRNWGHINWPADYNSIEDRAMQHMLHHYGAHTGRWRS